MGFIGPPLVCTQKSESFSLFNDYLSLFLSRHQVNRKYIPLPFFPSKTSQTVQLVHALSSDGQNPHSAHIGSLVRVGSL